MKKNSKNFSFRPDFHYLTATDALLHMGYSVDDAARITGYTPRTVRRWLAADRPPRWFLPFLYAVYGGVICSDAFAGWRFFDDELMVPGLRVRFTAFDLEQYHWIRESRYFQIEKLKAENARLREQLKNGSERFNFHAVRPGS